MSDAVGGRWVDDPPLPELVAPPAHLIQAHGAQLVRIYSIDHPDVRRRKGFTEALFIAWAPIPDSHNWAALTVWLGHWHAGGRTTGEGRYAWLRLATDDIERGRVRAVKPHVKDEDEWHGHDPTSEFSHGVRQAAATLPEELRERAVRPRPTATSEPQASPAPAPAPRRSDAV